MNKPWVVVFLAIAVVGAGIGGYLSKGSQPEPQPKEPITVPTKSEPGVDTTDMEKRIHDLVGTLGGAIPATSLAKGFHVPDLGMRIAFLTPEQSASTLGAMPAGAVGDGSGKRTTHSEGRHSRRRRVAGDRR